MRLTKKGDVLVATGEVEALWPQGYGQNSNRITIPSNDVLLVLDVRPHELTGRNARVLWRSRVCYVLAYHLEFNTVNLHLQKIPEDVLSPPIQ